MKLYAQNSNKVGEKVIGILKNIGFRILSIYIIYFVKKCRNMQELIDDIFACIL